MPLNSNACAKCKDARGPDDRQATLISLPVFPLFRQQSAWTDHCLPSPVIDSPAVTASDIEPNLQGIETRHREGFQLKAIHVNNPLHGTSLQIDAKY